MGGMDGSAAPAFFILSSGRSGSTLLAAMLNMHPRIHVPVELFGLYSQLPRLLPWYGNLRQDFNRRLLAKDLARTGQLAEFGIPFDCDHFAERLHSAGAGLAPVIRCFYETLLAASGKVILGDKTPNHSPYLPVIERTFPAARIIHLVRDGRDCAASSRRSRQGLNQRNVYELGRLWPRNNAAIAEFGVRHPARYHRLRYEDLIADPASRLARVCDFLGEAFHPGMLDHASGEFARQNATRLGHHANLTRTVLQGNEAKWKTALSAREVAVYESLAGDALRRFGYPPSGRVRVPGSGALRLGCQAVTEYRRVFRALRSARVESRQRMALVAKRMLHALRRS